MTMWGWGLAIVGEDDSGLVVRRGEDVLVRARTPSSFLADPPSLGTCFGSLTSPPLVTAALVHAGPNTIEALQAYIERDASNGWGAGGFAVAAIERLGGTATDAIADDDDRQELAAMLVVARRIRR